VNNLRYYAPEDVLNSIVVDSQGLIFGRLSEVKYERNEVYLIVDIIVETRRRVIDYNELKKRYPEITWVRDDELKSLAKQMDITIPYREIIEKVPIRKGSVPLSEVVGIDKKAYFDIQKLEFRYDSIILLSSAREARYRGIKMVNREYKHPDQICDKIVISTNAELLGKVETVVIGPREPGIRLKPYVSKGEILWLSYINTLKKEFNELASILSDKIDPYKNSRIPLERISEIKKLINIGKWGTRVLDILKENIVLEREPTKDIPWSKIKKIGDVIIVEADEYR